MLGLVALADWLPDRRVSLSYSPWYWLVFMVAAAAFSFVGRRGLRIAALRRHVGGEAGEPVGAAQAPVRPEYTVQSAFAVPPEFAVPHGPPTQVWPAFVVLGGVACLGAGATAAVLLARIPGSAGWVSLVTAAAALLGAGAAARTRTKLARRLASRLPEPDRPALRWPAPLVTALAVVAAGVAGVLVAGVMTLNDAGLTPLVVAALSLLLAPAVLAAGLTARQAERTTSLVVTLREVGLGVFGYSDVIPPKPPASLPYPPPPAAG